MSASAWLEWDEARLDAGWQGIRFLELSLIVPLAPDQPYGALLTAHLASPPASALTAGSLAVTGGRRIVDPPWTIDAQQLLAPDPWVRLRFPAIGDHSEYTIALLDGTGAPLHPFFSRAQFVFALDCERGDCRPTTERAPREAKSRPAIDLLTKDYQGFVELLEERILVSNPHWADLAPASLERVLIELLSHHADHLSYYQDRVAGEAFLDTASQRLSLRRHGKLLGYDLFDGAAAETILAFTVGLDGWIEPRSRVAMPGASGESEVEFFVLERTRVRALHNRLPLAAWPGAVDARIPRGATRVLLFGHIAGLERGQRIAIQSGTFTQVVTLRAVRPQALPGWVQQPADPPPANPLANPTAVTEIEWDDPLQLALPVATVVIFGNLADARFGMRREATLTFGELARANDRHATVIARDPSGRRLLRALRVPERPVLFTRGRDGDEQPMIEVAIDGAWTAQEHLHNSKSFDQHYVAHADEDGSLWLELGDDVRGRAIDLDSAGGPIVLTYWIGDPIAGNCAAGTLTRLVDPLPGLGAVLVTNVVPGRGGRQPETKEAARLAIPASLRHGPLQRSVSLEDYAAAARTVPGVARATARAIGGVFNTILVLVDPEGQTKVSDELQRAVMERVDMLRMAGREHFVLEPEYVPLEIRLALCVEPGHLAHRVRDAVFAALRPGTADRPGFFHPDRLSFGETVEMGDILAIVQRVPGVRSAKLLSFRRLRVASAPPVEDRIRLDITQVARLDADDNYPENGKLAVLVAGVDPGVTEQDFELLGVP